MRLGELAVAYHGYNPNKYLLIQLPALILSNLPRTIRLSDRMWILDPHQTQVIMWLHASQGGESNETYVWLDGRILLGGFMIKGRINPSKIYSYRSVPILPNSWSRYMEGAKSTEHLINASQPVLNPSLLWASDSAIWQGMRAGTNARGSGDVFLLPIIEKGDEEQQPDTGKLNLASNSSHRSVSCNSSDAIQAFYSFDCRGSISQTDGSMRENSWTLDGLSHHISYTYLFKTFRKRNKNGPLFLPLIWWSSSRMASPLLFRLLLSLLFLSVSLGSSSTLRLQSDDAYISAVVSEKGLAFAKDLLVERAVETLTSLRIRDIEKSVGIPIVGVVRMVASNITLEAIHVSSSTVQPGESGIVIVASGTTANLSMDWFYSYTTWFVPFEISDKGGAFIQVLPHWLLFGVVMVSKNWTLMHCSCLFFCIL